MLKQTVVMASLMLGWMLSSDALVRLGNGIAQNSTLFLAALAICALATCFGSAMIHHPQLRHNYRNSPVGLLIEGVGKLPAMAVILTTRTMLTLLLPTGLLVSAGFAFNEIFVYWFPNFGFSFIVLALITSIHLFGEKTAAGLQPLFVGVTALCLAILCLGGLSAPTEAGPLSVDTGFLFTGAGLAGCFLLFLGIDAVPLTSYSSSRLHGFMALFVALLLFLFWSMVSLQHVPAEKLADSTIPHLTAARKILGQPGRVLMGIAIISGCCGLVNMLFISLRLNLAELAVRNMLPGYSQRIFRPARYVILFAILIGCLLMGGLAGKESVETYIQAALLLWLIQTGLLCFSAGRLLKKLTDHPPAGSYMIAALFLLCAGYLIAVDPNRATILGLLGIALAGSTCVSAFWLKREPTVEIVPEQQNHGGTP